MNINTKILHIENFRHPAGLCYVPLSYGTRRPNLPNTSVYLSITSFCRQYLQKYWRQKEVIERLQRRHLWESITGSPLRYLSWITMSYNNVTIEFRAILPKIFLGIFLWKYCTIVGPLIVGTFHSEYCPHLIFQPFIELYKFHRQQHILCLQKSV